MKRMVIAGLIAAGLAVAAAPLGAQALKFDEVIGFIQRCDVDKLKNLFQQDRTDMMAQMRNQEGVPLIVAASETNCVEGVKFLWTKGAMFDQVDKTGRAPLHAAAAKSTASMVEYIISKKGDVNAKTSAGDTPLMLAKTNNYKGKDEEQKKIIDVLVKKGAKE